MVRVKDNEGNSFLFGAPDVAGAEHHSSECNTKSSPFALPFGSGSSSSSSTSPSSFLSAAPSFGVKSHTFSGSTPSLNVGSSSPFGTANAPPSFGTPQFPWSSNTSSATANNNTCILSSHGDAKTRSCACFGRLNNPSSGNNINSSTENPPKASTFELPINGTSPSAFVGSSSSSYASPLPFPTYGSVINPLSGNNINSSTENPPKASSFVPPINGNSPSAFFGDKAKIANSTTTTTTTRPCSCGGKLNNPPSENNVSSALSVSAPLFGPASVPSGTTNFLTSQETPNPFQVPPFAQFPWNGSITAIPFNAAIPNSTYNGFASLYGTPSWSADGRYPYGLPQHILLMVLSPVPTTPLFSTPFATPSNDNQLKHCTSCCKCNKANNKPKQGFAIFSGSSNNNGEAKNENLPEAKATAATPESTICTNRGIIIGQGGAVAASSGFSFAPTPPDLQRKSPFDTTWPGSSSSNIMQGPNQGFAIFSGSSNNNGEPKNENLEAKATAATPESTICPNRGIMIGQGGAVAASSGFSFTPTPPALQRKSPFDTTWPGSSTSNIMQGPNQGFPLVSGSSNNNGEPKNENLEAKATAATPESTICPNRGIMIGQGGAVAASSGFSFTPTPPALQRKSPFDTTWPGSSSSNIMQGPNQGFPLVSGSSKNNGEAKNENLPDLAKATIAANPATSGSTNCTNCGIMISRASNGPEFAYPPSSGFFYTPAPDLQWKCPFGTPWTGSSSSNNSINNFPSFKSAAHSLFSPPVQNNEPSEFKYVETVEEGGYGGEAKLVSISAMPVFRNQSVEELRWKNCQSQGKIAFG